MAAADILRLQGRRRALTLWVSRHLLARRRARRLSFLRARDKEEVMISRPAPATRPDAARNERAAVQPAGVRSTVRVEAAANDDKPAAGFSVYGDPLFGIAVATAIMFAMLAALIAS
jgi:hypothetical protein